MTVQEIHRHIWSAVVDALEAEEEDYADYTEFLDEKKGEAATQLLIDGHISLEARRLLSKHSNCVLCTLFYRCRNCPLESCQYGLYAEVEVDGDINSARKIRDLKIPLSNVSRTNRRVLENVDFEKGV